MKNQAKYVDGFVLSIAKNKLAAYRKMATDAKKVWLDHGALDYKECIADDMRPQEVNFTFPKMAKARKNEVVFFSYIAYKSKAHRNAVNKKVMKDPRIANYDGKDMPFDMKRMAYGGFKVFVGM